MGDEDCLTRNVYAVNPPASSKQPVIVFIHGGGNRAGSAQDPPWIDVPPLAGHGVIVVTVQYRLGLLGWLVHPLLTAKSPQGSSRNYTLMDLIAADGLDSPDRLGAAGEWTKLSCRTWASHTTCTGRSTSKQVSTTLLSFVTEACMPRRT